jgi:hypothetical protein
MAVNPDPRPGRWILPLVVLGMIAFTYFFVRELPEASTDTTLVSGGPTTTTLDDGSTTTTGGGGTLDPATEAYLGEIDNINTDLQVQRTEFVTVNNSFNEEPRGIEYTDAEARFEAVVTATEELAQRLRDLTPPTALEPNHTNLQGYLDDAVTSATEALDGLRSTDTGQRRNDGVNAYVQAATDYDTEVTNTHNEANA